MRVFFDCTNIDFSIKHLNELAAAVSKGYKAILAFVIQMEGVEMVLPNTKTHPEFAAALENAQKAGVEVWFLPCKVQPDNLSISGQNHL
ncbi:MAG: DNA/RNA nuclease SfsA [Spirochaetales bacterium]|nr:DNA/RNA nuclease SfsA [Spirochaetales bacterium]